MNQTTVHPFIRHLHIAKQLVLTRAPKTLANAPMVLIAIDKAIVDGTLVKTTLTFTTAFGLVEVDLSSRLVDGGLNHREPDVFVTAPTIARAEVDRDLTLYAAQLAEIAQFANLLKNTLLVG